MAKAFLNERIIDVFADDADLHFDIKNLPNRFNQREILENLTGICLNN